MSELDLISCWLCQRSWPTNAQFSPFCNEANNRRTYHDFKGPVFSEIKAQGFIEDDKLYNRDEAAKQLAIVLLTSLGVHKTPFMDNSFGAGKTSLAHSFRKYLVGVTLTGLDVLNQAIYLHINCEKFQIEIPPKDRHIAAAYDSRLLLMLSEVLETSCGRTLHLDCSGIREFGLGLSRHCGSTKFIFHFDDGI